MRKQRRNKGKRHLKAYTVHVQRVGFVKLAPARESKHPFCAYYGPNGETCSQTNMLMTVGTLPSSPPVMYMACPLHYDAAYQVIQQFLAELATLSKQM